MLYEVRLKAIFLQQFSAVTMSPVDYFTPKQTIIQPPLSWCLLLSEDWLEAVKQRPKHRGGHVASFIQKTCLKL